MTHFRLLLAVATMSLGLSACSVEIPEPTTGTQSGSVGDHATATNACKAQPSSVAKVELKRAKYPLTADHLEDAITKGEVVVMHIDRGGADANRKDSLRGIATKPGHDRDEYPMAVSREGGKGADVRYVPSSDNRGAGSSVGGQLRKYGDGAAFCVIVVG